MKMRHDSWHPASISSTPASCGAAKIRAQKRCLYRQQWINVAQAAVQDWGRVGSGGRRRRRWMPTQRPNPCRDGNVHFKWEEKITRALWGCWQAETSCHAPPRSDTLESPTGGGDEGFSTLLNFSGCLKRTCNLMQRQREWATGQPAQRMKLYTSILTPTVHAGAAGRQQQERACRSGKCFEEESRCITCWSSTQKPSH